jgi:hypothetical protein
MEMAKEYALNCMGENEDEDDEDGGDTAAPLAPTPPAAMPEEIIEEEALVEMVLEQEAPMAHEVILADAEPDPLQPRLFNMIMSWMIWTTCMIWMMTQMKVALTWLSGSPKMGVMIGIELSRLSM